MPKESKSKEKTKTVGAHLTQLQRTKRTMEAKAAWEAGMPYLTKMDGEFFEHGTTIPVPVGTPIVKKEYDRRIYGQLPRVKIINGIKFKEIEERRVQWAIDAKLTRENREKKHARKSLLSMSMNHALSKDESGPPSTPLLPMSSSLSTSSCQHSVQWLSPHHFPLPPDSLPSSVISAPSPVASSSSSSSVSSLPDSSYSPLIAGGANVINGRREPGLVLSENSMGPPAPKVKKRKRQELEKDPRSGGQSFRKAPVSAYLRRVGPSKSPKGLPPRRLKISQSLLSLGAAPASTYESPSKGLPSGRVAVPEPLKRLKIHRSLLLPDKRDFTDLTAEIAIDIFEHGQEPLILAGLPDGDRIIKPPDIYQEFAEEYVAHAMGDGATRPPMSLSPSTSSSQPPISAPQPSASRASLSLPSSLPGFASSGAVSRSAPRDLVAPSSPLRAMSVFPPTSRFNPSALPPLSLGDRMVSYESPPSPSPYVIEPLRDDPPATPILVEAELGDWEEPYDGEGAEALALGRPPR